MAQVESSEILKMLSEISYNLNLAIVAFVDNQTTKEIAKKNMDEYLVKIKNILYYYSD